ncbi:MAG: class I SAM-dependent methyltransferase [Anaerolineae bacterium]
MLNMIECNVETSQEGFLFTQPVVNKITVQPKKENHPINYLKQLYRCGVRANDRVLVVGAGNTEMLEKMAKLVGSRGNITVLDSDQTALKNVQTAADTGQFTAFKQFTGGHPAFDMRSDSQKYLPVKVNTDLLSTTNMSFEDSQFDVVWVEALPQALTAEEQSKLLSELKRISDMVVYSNA